jgi:hypothetical protein
MNILERKKISFYNKVDQFGRNYKHVYPVKIDELTGYVTGFQYVSDLDDLLIEITSAMSGNLPSNGIDYSTDDLFATLKNTGISFSFEADSPEIVTESLSDLKELCEAWRAFLLTPPLNGSKVR